MSIIIIKPILTEKMTELGAMRQYAFKVLGSANKISIKTAVEKKFNVKVTSVRTISVHGKLKSQQTKSGVRSGRRASWKKAIVTLAKDNAIDFFQTA